MSSEEPKNLDSESAEDSKSKVEETQVPDLKYSLPSVFMCNPDESLGMDEDDNDGST